MNKKTYILPECKVIDLEQDSVLLAGSPSDEVPVGGPAEGAGVKENHFIWD